MPGSGYGTFHQQYRLEGRLIAVGIIDVLPRCLSSVYLFWEPECASMSLGGHQATWGGSFDILLISSRLPPGLRQAHGSERDTVGEAAMGDSAESRVNVCRTCGINFDERCRKEQNFNCQ